MEDGSGKGLYARAVYVSVCARVCTEFPGISHAGTFIAVGRRARGTGKGTCGPGEETYIRLNSFPTGTVPRLSRKNNLIPINIISRGRRRRRVAINLTET